jgi:hypothetical protein
MAMLIYIWATKAMSWLDDLKASDTGKKIEENYYCKICYFQEFF